MQILNIARCAVAAAALLLTPVSVLAQPEPAISSQAIGAPVSITLSSGETIRGTFGGVEDGKVMLDHPVLGRIGVPEGAITAWAPTPVDAQGVPVAAPAGAPPAEPEAAPAPEPAKPAAPPPPLAPTSFLEGWTGSVELGLNGSEGNKSRINLRGGVSGARKTEETETTLSFVYSYSREEGVNTKNKAQVDARNDWILGKDSPWRVYALGRLEYDEFQDWDVRLSGFSGVGYQLIKSDRTSLIGRVGLGGSREIGGQDNRIHPELDLGFDLEHKLTERQKFTLSIDYYPDLLRITDYRVVGKAAYEILLDPESQLTLKLGVEDRYDSTPEGAKRSDLDYFAILMFKF